MLLFITINFYTITDILLAAFIFYQVYKLVKGTVAINIFAGIFTFYVAWLLVKALNLELVSGILGQFIGMGVIALLIVFQQEVRRFLLLLGSKYNLQNIFNLERLFTKTSIKDEVAAAIVQACDYFSKTKTGALIVLSQNSELYNYAQTGVLIRSIVSEELLENIFFKNSPLHDGAVIIRDGAIVAAACFLPLAEDIAVARELGTRHRAALGVSSVSDSVTIVVSEETGVISFAREGKLVRYIDQKALHDLLESIFVGKEAAGTLNIFKRRAKHEK